jgi:hypothetical protein
MGINFGSGVPWGAISQTEHRRMARDSTHPLYYRVYFAALGWAYRLGHAEFGEGALGRILSGKDGKPLSAPGVSNAIDRAKKKGLITSESGTRCLVLGGWQFQKAGLGSGSCRTHALRTA